MRLVSLDEGRLEVRWTWLPYWIAVGPAYSREIEALTRDAVIMNGLPPTDESLDLIDGFVVRQVAARFQIPGLGEYLRAIRFVEEPA